MSEHSKEVEEALAHAERCREAMSDPEYQGGRNYYANLILLADEVKRFEDRCENLKRASQVPYERRCPQCNFRSGQTETCVVDGSKMEPVTWKDAALTADRIASKARQRALALEADWPADFPMPIGSLDDLSIEDKVEQLREKGLYDIAFRNTGVGLMFFEPPADFIYPEWTPGMSESELKERDRSWRKYLTVETYYNSFDEAVSAEFEKRR